MTMNSRYANVRAFGGADLCLDNAFSVYRLTQPIVDILQRFELATADYRSLGQAGGTGRGLSAATALAFVAKADMAIDELVRYVGSVAQGDGQLVVARLLDALRSFRDQEQRRRDRDTAVQQWLGTVRL